LGSLDFPSKVGRNDTGSHIQCRSISDTSLSAPAQDCPGHTLGTGWDCRNFLVLEIVLTIKTQSFQLIGKHNAALWNNKRAPNVVDGSSYCFITAMALTLSRTGRQGIFATPVWRLAISRILEGHTSSCMILAQERRSYRLSLETTRPDSERGEMRWNSFQSAANRSVHMTDPTCLLMNWAGETAIFSSPINHH